MHPYKPTNSPYISSQQAQQAVHALASALSNPYAHSFTNQQQNHLSPNSSYSPHYAQAYLQGSSSTRLTTPEGYTLSSTYAPIPHVQRGRGGLVQRGRGTPRRGAFLGAGSSNMGGWYEPGNDRCTHEQCAFTGSKKSVETHMMDRHLIFPPGWENRKRKPDWDADPSLNTGKPLPIYGTNVILDTPEAVDAWISERKKRWPTDTRKEERGKKLQEAVERGEIAALDPSLRGQKRQRTDDALRNDRGRGRDRGNRRGGQASRLRGRGDSHSVASAHHIDTSLPKKPPPTNTATNIALGSDTDSNSDSDVDPLRDAISSKSLIDIIPEVPVVNDDFTDDAMKLKETERTESSQLQAINRRPAPPPRPPPRVPFSNRQSLLRNLLLPEIRFTVSNLSQAIHFLVQNDLLQDVELKPGEIDDQPIEVITESYGPSSD